MSSSCSVPEILGARWRHQQDEQLVVGIGGGSGSGKSTAAALLSDGLAPLSVCVVNQDRFFKPQATMPTYYSTLHRADRPDFNHPESFDRHEMIASCRKASGHDILIIEGILALHFSQLRSLMHLKCYVTIDLEEMLARRTRRNLAAGYGGGPEEIARYNTECVTPQHRRFNAPTAGHADLLITNDSGRSQERDRIIADVCAAVHHLKRPNDPPIPDGAKRAN